MKARRATAVSLLLAFAAGCSTGGHPAAVGRSIGSPTTRHPAPPPPVATLTATEEPWHLPAPVSRPVVLPGGTGFVILGGLATGDTSTARIVEADLATGTSSVVGQLGVAVHDSAGAAIADRYYVFGGGSYSTVREVQEWSGGTATKVADLPTPRSDLSAVTAAGTTYIAGGFDGTTMTPQVLATTDGTTFRTVGQLAVPVRYGAAAVAGGSLWVVGGVTGTSEGSTAETDAIQKVDLATGAASIVGHLPAPMGHATAVTLGGQIFVLGGRSGTTASPVIWRIDQTTGRAVQAGQLPSALSDAGSVVVGDHAYLVGGEVSGPEAPLDTVVELSPRA